MCKEWAFPCTRVRPAMGTWVAIEAEAATEACALGAVNAAFATFQVVEGCMHPDREGSDLRRIARARAGEVLSVHPWTRATLSLSQWLNSISAGGFDLALPDQKGSVAHLQPEADDRVRVLRPVQLDLRGIAKGFAIDRAIDALVTTGCSAGMVNAGGDLRVFGQLPRQLLVRTSASEGRPLVLHNRALCLSAVAVIAATAALANGLTKCLMLSPRAQHQRLLEVTGAALLAG